jgi:protein ImuB
LIEILHVWGLQTIGDLARLPRGDLHARLGPIGVRLHQTACGEDVAPMVPVAAAPRFVERIELEWPIDGLEPLSFVLARQCEALAIALERADRGAVTIATTLRLTTRAVHARVLHLPAPMRDARVLRTLILLDLESHPPPAAIDVVDLELEVTPGRIAHGALFARTLPSPEDLATLVARLGALMGETRIGAPVEVDTFDARRVGLTAFTIPVRNLGTSEPRNLGTPEPWSPGTSLSLRRYRLPLAASVALERGRPVSVSPSARAFSGGRVVDCAGPWRSSGAWWALDRRGWDRDEWDVQLADGVVYRIANDRGTGQWVVEGTVD